MSACLPDSVRARASLFIHGKSDRGPEEAGGFGLVCNQSMKPASQLSVGKAEAEAPGEAKSGAKKAGVCLSVCVCE